MSGSAAAGAVSLERVVRDYLRLHSIKLWEMESIGTSLVDDISNCCLPFFQSPHSEVRSILEKIHTDTKSRVAAPSATQDASSTSSGGAR